jgi:hypothetical protein
MFAVLHSDINSHKSRLLHLTGQPYWKKSRSAKVKDGIINLFLWNNLIDRYMNVVMPSVVMLMLWCPPSAFDMCGGILTFNICGRKKISLYIVLDYTLSKGRHDTQHNDIQHDETQHKNKVNVTLSITILCHYAGRRI